jgi:hypothetical protein
LRFDSPCEPATEKNTASVAEQKQAHFLQVTIKKHSPHPALTRQMPGISPPLTGGQDARIRRLNTSTQQLSSGLTSVGEVATVLFTHRHF